MGLGRLDLEMQAGGGKLDAHKFLLHGDDLDVTGDGVYSLPLAGTLRSPRFM